MSNDVTVLPYSGWFTHARLMSRMAFHGLRGQAAIELLHMPEVWLTVSFHDEPDVDLPAPLPVPVVDPPVDAVGVLLGMAVPRARVVPKRQLAHPWMAHEVDHTAVQPGDVGASPRR